MCHCARAHASRGMQAEMADLSPTEADPGPKRIVYDASRLTAESSGRSVLNQAQLVCRPVCLPSAPTENALWSPPCPFSLPVLKGTNATHRTRPSCWNLYVGYRRQTRSAITRRQVPTHACKRPWLVHNRTLQLRLLLDAIIKWSRIT